MISLSTQLGLPVSIVIPVRNESASLSELLKCLSALSPRPAEVVFVDAGSSDGSVGSIESWMGLAKQDGIQSQLCHRSDAYPGAARNAGVKAATQEWIAFLDVGISPNADWLGKLWARQQQSHALAVYGSCNFGSEHPFGRMICAVSYGQGQATSVLPASLFHKDVFEKAGFFEEHLRSGEDILWNQSTSSAGIATAYCPEALVEYRHFPETLGQALKKWFVYEQSASVAGVGSARKNLLLIAIALIYVFSILGVPGAFPSLLAYFVLRGGVEPYRRSTDRPWWRFWWQPLAMIPVAAMLDAATVAGRITGALGFSKFRLNLEYSGADQRFLPDVPANQWRFLAFLWLSFFCFSTITALLFQKILLPWQAALHAGDGLLIGDSQFFHAAAKHLAIEIANHGWSVWHLFPQPNAYGNVGVIGAIYALFGPQPSFVIPVNAGLHALSGVMIYLIIVAIGGGGRAATIAGTISAILFVALPSSLNWYGQLHKDGYVIAGMLIVLWTWITIVQFSNVTKVNLWLFVFQIIGFFLIGCARPYALKLLILISIVPIVVVLLKPQQATDCTQEKRERFGMFCVSIFINWICIMFFARLLSSWGEPSLQAAGENYAAWVSSAGWLWEKTPWLPVQIDAYFELLAKTRAAFIDFGIAERAGSMMDINRAPNNLLGMLAYLPRALQVAFFAPFPTSWLKHGSLLSLIATAEMIICYVAISGIPFLLRGVGRSGVLLTIFFAVAFLAIYGFTTPNLGTLYRVRYVFLMLIVSLGILGWTKLLVRPRRSINHGEAFQVPLRASEDITDSTSERWGVISSSFFVFGLTFICFFGFFVRDMLLAGRLGLSSELDGFYLALMLPMFAVSILSIPLGNAFTPVYLSALVRGGVSLAADLVSTTTRRVSLILTLVCLFILGSTSVILSTLGFAGSDSVAFVLEPVFYMALLILLLSGALVLGNAILNAHGDFKVSSAAQLLVPVCSIVALLVFDEMGVNGAMLGMVLGQALNLLVVRHYVRRNGVWLNIQSANQSVERENSELLSQYVPLLASALFVSLVAPASTLLAMQLPGGSVSALNLGAKVVMFITGLLNAALSAVMLPYFSSLIVRNHLFSARRELSYYMLASVFVSLPLTICLFFWARPLVSIIFPGANLNPEDLLLITKVMQYGVLQLPFFASNVLLLKFAIATRHVVAIWASATIGLIVNVVAGILLMKYMGIAGIALGSSLAMLVSTALLLSVLITKEHVALSDATRIGLNWLLFLTLILCLHFVNPIGMGVCLLGFLILFIDYFLVIRSAPKDEARYA